MTNNYKLSPAAILLAVTTGFGLISFFGYLISGYASFGIVFLNFLGLCADAFLCVILFMKRRDILLLAATAAAALISLINLLRFFSFMNLIAFAANAYVLVLALIVCEQSLVSLDLSSVSAFFKKFFFLPAAALTLIFVINFIRYISWGVVFGDILSLMISSALGVAAMYFLCSWLLDPYVTAVPLGLGYVYANSADASGGQKTDNLDDAFSSPAERGNAPCSSYCPLGKHIVLCLVTCGVWFYMWIFRTTRYLNRAPGAQQYVPVKKLLLCLFVPYYYIYWFCKHARRLTDLSNETDPAFTDQNTMYILFGIFIPVVACILMQVRINFIELHTAAPAASAYAESAAAETQATSSSSGHGVSLAKKPAPAAETHAFSSEQANIDALRSYKELLDSGVITQEEFDAKKRQLLGL